MGFFSRLGNKIASGVSSATRVGIKALGSVSRVGNKIADTASKVVSGIERVPVLGQILSPVTGVVRSGIGLVRDVADVAGTGRDLLTDAQDVVRRGTKALKTGNVAEATDVLRRGKNLVGTSKNTLERARDVQREAVKIATRKP
tara:strand:+ start:1759 stop:2190 length:432 start_codon:yes stop_codon:yes gene_type:complete